MKSKKAIDWTEEFETMDGLFSLAGLMCKLKVPGAEKFWTLAEDTHTEIFCEDCEMDHDNCECRPRYQRGYDDC